MSDGQLWLQHLSASLRANRQLAYLYHVEKNTYEFMGDFLGVLGCDENNAPQDKNSLAELVADEDRVTRQLSLADMTAKCREGEKTFTLKYKMRRPDGTLLPIIETGIARFNTKDKTSTIQSLLAIDTETIDRQKKMSRKMGFRESVSSSFSGNNERKSLIHRLEEITTSGERDWSQGYLLLVGIDRISLVNEVYGSQFTDELLEKTGQCLKSMVKDNAEIVRVAGDIFGLLFSKDPQGQMRDTAQKILNVFYNQPIEVQEKLMHQVVSIGGVRISDRTVAPASLLGRAELALNDAKQKGRGCFIEYSDHIGEEVKNFKDVLSIGDNFLKNFKDGRVKMAFQGVVSSRTNDVSFYECLIRMIDENGEVHSAGQFIEAVEKMGLTRLVDTFATQQAIMELKEYPTISLSVNVSNHTLTDPDWLRTVTFELRDYPEVANRLIVEITESVAMSDVNQTLRVIRVLQDLGCRIALDDFGAGQTAFTQMKDLALDIVKIDKSFVREMDREENKHFIKTLQSLASAMNLETVGEGAETIAEADILARDGIDHIQGFVHGLPSMDRLWLSKRGDKKDYKEE
jgi:diguanylate cyclase (GGDEF)-like protein